MRWYKHRWEARRGKNYPLHRALRKYGEEAFKFEILGEYPTNEEACEEEIRLISSVPVGMKYNVAKGGDGGQTLTPSQLEAQRTIKAADHGEFTRMYHSGRTVESMAEHFGVGPTTIQRCAKRLGLGAFNSRKRPRKCNRMPKPSHPPHSYRDSGRQAEVMRRVNKDRGISEALQKEVLRLYLEEDLTAGQVADQLNVSKGAVRGTVNRAYDLMSKSERLHWKKRHGSVVRSGQRNSRSATNRCREK